jgi:quinoprotein glucose dehydrogenase
MTSPPAVIDDLVVVGSSIDDNTRVDMPSGVVRAFDARTGKLRWSWDPIPPSPTPDRKTGAANAWSVMVVDPVRDLVFVPTGSASPDFFGGGRPGDNRWADSVVALHARTGEIAWGFQLVHHNLWDYDTAAPPLLATLRQNGKEHPVVVQGNKSGFLYVLDRDTGVPIFPVVETPVPQSELPGEHSFPTQPIPSAPPALSRQTLTAAEAWGRTPEDLDFCRKALTDAGDAKLFSPPTTRATLTYPGHIGGMNWSGYALDPARQLLLVNTNELPFLVRQIPRDQYEAQRQASKGGDFTAQIGAPFGLFRTPLLSPHGLPCTPPPWGRLTAVDLAAGTIRWQVALGGKELSPGVMSGSTTLGGPIVTGGGLVFIAGTIDPALRAFDVETGRELWKGALPASGHATPMTFQLPGGKQMVVIAAGGHAKLEQEPQGDELVAFTLP